MSNYVKPISHVVTGHKASLHPDGHLIAETTLTIIPSDKPQTVVVKQIIPIQKVFAQAIHKLRQNTAIIYQLTDTVDRLSNTIQEKNLIIKEYQKQLAAVKAAQNCFYGEGFAIAELSTRSHSN